MSADLFDEDEEPRRGFTGYFIPVEVLDDPELRPTDKLLLAEIIALSKNSEGACRASNAHLAKHVGMSAGGVVNALTRLRKAGYIQDVRFDGRKRWIRATMMDAGSINRCMQTTSNDGGRPHQMMDQKDKEKEKEKSKRQSAESVDFRDEELQQEWAAYQEHRKEKRNVMTIMARGRAVAKLTAMGRDRAIAALRHSIEQGYTGIFEPKASKPRDEYGRVKPPKTARELERERIMDRDMAEGEKELRKLREKQNQKGKQE